MSVFRFGTIRSPPRRSTMQFSDRSPFCTSPSQLQDVTLDPSMSATLPVSLGVRSPGKISPIRGRTMKEYEEELGQLQKENFNLKLRIFFMEERREHMKGLDCEEGIIKENIDLKVKVETLKKELCHKQDIVRQAARAVDQMDEQHKEKIQHMQQIYQEQKEVHGRRINELEQELKKLTDQQSEQRFQKLADVSTLELTAIEKYIEKIEEQQQYIDDLESEKHRLECELQEETVGASNLKAELQQQHQRMHEAREHCETMEHQLRKQDLKLQELTVELEQSNKNQEELKQHILSLEAIIHSKDQEIEMHVKKLCDQDSGGEDKASKLKNQNKALSDLQMSLDEKQRQNDTLRSHIMSRDSVIKSLEAKYASSKASMRNLEFQLAASQQHSKKLEEEVHSLKRYVKHKLIDGAGGDSAPTSPSKSSWSSCLSKSSHLKNRNSDGFVEMAVKQLQEMESKLKIAEEKDKICNEKLRVAELKIHDQKRQLSALENQLKDISENLKESCTKNRQVEEKFSRLEHNNKVACQTIQNFVRRTKELEKENEELKDLVHKKQKYTQEIIRKFNEAFSKERCDSKAQHGEVQRMKLEKEEECQVAKQNGAIGQVDYFSYELETMVQSLLKAIKEKQESFEDLEKKFIATTHRMKEKEGQVIGLEEEVRELHNCLNSLQHLQTKQTEQGEKECKKQLNSELIELVNVVETKTHNMLLQEVQEKNQEIERLNAELRRRTTNLQELVNKELWDKNREIEKLQDRLNIMCERKELQIRSVGQELTNKELQFKALQNKIIEYVTQPNLSTALILEELRSLALAQSITSQNDGSRQVENLKDVPLQLQLMTSGVAEAGASIQGRLLATLEDNKYLSQKVEALQEKIRNTPERDSESRVIQNLKSECTRLREDAELADKKYRDAREGINVLMSHLQELVLFLSSLLENKELLGGISIQRHDLLRKVLENSIELSRQLSASFSLCQAGNETASSLQFSRLSDIMCLTNHNFNISELLKDEESQGVSKKYDFSSSCMLPCDKSRAENQDINGVENQKLKSELGNEASNTSDLIKFFTPPPEKNLSSSLTSMTFYNSHHLGRSKSEVGSKSHDENMPLFSSTNQTQKTESNVLSPVKDLHSLHSSKSTPVVSLSSLSECVDKSKLSPARVTKPSATHSRDSVSIQKSNSPLNNIAAPEKFLQSLSDSEAWSEPDRNVSMERIGLQEDTGRVTLTKSRNARIQESEHSCESSEETAREETRIPVVKRTRGDSGEIKRLQNKVHSLEQLNDALKTEVDILHQLSCHPSFNTDSSICSTKIKEINNSALRHSESCDTTSDFIPLNLLKQIQHQRGKLEASLLHNELIRKQLEAIVSRLSLSDGDDAQNMRQKFKEITEELTMFQTKVFGLEKELAELRENIKDKEQKINYLEVTNKELQVVVNVSSGLKNEISNLQAIIQEKDNEILERKCLHLELDNKSEEQNIENEKKIHYFKILKDEAEMKLVKSEEKNTKYKEQICELENKIKSLDSKVLQEELKSEELRKETSEQITMLEGRIYESNMMREEAEKHVCSLKKELEDRDIKILNLVHKLQLAEEDSTLKMRELEEIHNKCKEMESNASLKISAMEKQLVEREWVYKTDMEKKNSDIEKAKQIEEGLRHRLGEFECREQELKMDLELRLKQCEENYKESELFLKQKLEDIEQFSRLKESELRRELDEAGVAASEIALERTKLVNEKLRLEQEMRRFELRLSELEKCRSETESRLQSSNVELVAKVKELEEENNSLKNSVQSLELANVGLERTLAKAHERYQSLPFSRSSGCVSGVDNHEMCDQKPELLSPTSLTSELEMFSGTSGSLPSSLNSLSAKYFDSLRDQTNNCGIQEPFRSRQYSNVSDYVSEDLSSEEYRSMVHRPERQLSAPCLNSKQMENATANIIELVESRNSTSSPDLGIESDHGRFSSLEAASIPSNPTIQLETTQYLENREGKLETVSTIVLNSRTGLRDFAKLEEENAELKRKLFQTRRALEKTVEQLMSANQKKKQVEKAICKQLYKTHNILKQSRANLQNDPSSVTGVHECE